MIKNLMKKLGVSRRKEEKVEEKKKVTKTSKPKKTVKPKVNKTVSKPVVKKVKNPVEKVVSKKTVSKKSVPKVKVQKIQSGKCEICKLHTKKYFVCKDCGTKFCNECGNTEIEVCEDCMQFNASRRMEAVDEIDESAFS